MNIVLVGFQSNKPLCLVRFFSRAISCHSEHVLFTGRASRQITNDGNTNDEQASEVVIGDNAVGSSKAFMRIMTTRIAGGLHKGYNPMAPGQGLKSLALTAFRPQCP